MISGNHSEEHSRHIIKDADQHGKTGPGIIGSAGKVYIHVSKYLYSKQ